MRIIAGQFRSRHLKATPPPGTRPTSDKLRETLFNILGESVRGCTFLDGCAGVGAIGIEAISRGAETVVFIDQFRKAARMIRENLDALGIKEGFKILEMDLRKGLQVCSQDGIQFDVAFVDPPYEQEQIYSDALERFSTLSLIAADGVLIFEHSKRKDLVASAGNLKRVRTLIQGDSVLTFFRAEAH
jgi:16S rRNA (guanine(966)-N(2))-methyltransferase RsmD